MKKYSINKFIKLKNLFIILLILLLNKQYIILLGGSVGSYSITGPRYVKNTEIIDVKEQVVKRGPRAPFSKVATIQLKNGDIFLISGNQTAIFKVNKLLKGEK